MAALNILGIGDEQQPGSLLGIPGAQALDISPPNADRPVEQRDALAGLYNNVTDYIKRERERSSDMGLWNDETGLPTGKGLLSAAQQYGEALLMGTTAPGAPKPAFDWTPGGGTKTAQVGKTELTYGIDRTGATGEVVLVKTPPAERGQGEARRAMEEFVDHADTQGTTLFLNADPMDKGVSKSGLDRFYRSLGFVKNMGKRKDFRSTAEYVRQPVAGAQGSGE